MQFSVGITSVIAQVFKFYRNKVQYIAAVASIKPTTREA